MKSPKYGKMKISDNQKGIIAGYKPNRISLYILMLTTGRHNELKNLLYKDMEEYKIKEDDE